MVIMQGPTSEQEEEYGDLHKMLFLTLDRVTNTNSQSQKHQTTERVLEKKESKKKRQYNNRIMNIEHGTFTPLVFSVTGVMGKECSVFHKAHCR